MIQRAARLALAAAAVVTLLVTMPGLSWASAPANGGATVVPQDVVYRTEHRLVNKTYIGDTTSHWKTCLHVAKSAVRTHPSCSFNVTVSTSVEVSGGFSDGTLSAGFGFDVSVSYSYGYGITVDVPAHTAGDIQVGVYYYQYWGDIQTRTCVVQNGSCTPWSSPGTYT